MSPAILRLPTHVKPLPSSTGKTSLSTGWLSHWLVRAVLFSSLVVNMFLMGSWGDNASSSSRAKVVAENVNFPDPVSGDDVASNAKVQSSTKVAETGCASASVADSDGDGVPDHHDFCPGGCLNKGNCPTLNVRRAWMSGRATDFDGDGCEDGVEDTDMDNDGIQDSVDRCPRTPQKYTFVSNALSDFDGDGCVDGIEDSDDDGDGTANMLDDCPRTNPGHASDSTGCSDKQRKQVPPALERSQHGQPSDAPIQVQNGSSSVMPESASQFLELIRNAWVEVILGASMTWFMHHIKRGVETLHQQLPRSPSGSVKRLSIRTLEASKSTGPIILTITVKALGYFVFFVAVYQYRKQNI